MISTGRSDGLDIGAIRSLVRNVCEIAGSRTLIDDARVELASAGVIEAIQTRDNDAIFNWLLEIMQFQGVSDAAARVFVEEHGLITAQEIARGLSRKPPCSKLKSYYHFEDCGYRKWKWHCNAPNAVNGCPLPRHEFRNGTLNQLAYSLFFFVRDVCDGDFVGWIDHQVIKSKRDEQSKRHRIHPLVDALAHIQGIGPKIASLAIAILLLGGDAERKDWLKAGGSILVVDRLVHAWMHRTGLLKAAGAEHLYGAHCYGTYGCAALLYRLARQVNARRFNPDYPRYFPRFVQFAIWSFCSADGFNICNGNQIDDRKRCQRRDCDLYQSCGRERLHRPAPKENISVVS